MIVFAGNVGSEDGSPQLSKVLLHKGPAVRTIFQGRSNHRPRGDSWWGVALGVDILQHRQANSSHHKYSRCGGIDRDFLALMTVKEGSNNG